MINHFLQSVDAILEDVSVTVTQFVAVLVNRHKSEFAILRKSTSFSLFQRHGVTNWNTTLMFNKKSNVIQYVKFILRMIKA